MTQKMIIEVETSKPLSSYGEGHVIVYNAQKRNYYVTSRNNLLAPQNAKIGELEKIVEDAESQIEKTKTNIDDTVAKLVSTFEDFRSGTSETMNGRIDSLTQAFENFKSSTKIEFDTTVNTLINTFVQAQAETRAEIQAFKSKIESEQAQFYATYKETNAKILELVKKTCLTNNDSATTETAEAEGDNV